MPSLVKLKDSTPINILQTLVWVSGLENLVTKNGLSSYPYYTIRDFTLYINHTPPPICPNFEAVSPKQPPLFSALCVMIQNIDSIYNTLIFIKTSVALIEHIIYKGCSHNIFLPVLFETVCLSTVIWEQVRDYEITAFQYWWHANWTALIFPKLLQTSASEYAD